MTIGSNSEVEDAVSRFGAYLREQTLAKNITFADESSMHGTRVEWDDAFLMIAVEKIR